MKILILFFSGTGNTFWVAMELQKALAAMGADCRIHSLESPQIRSAESRNSMILSAEHIVLAFPVYGSDMPSNMKRVLAEMPLFDNKKNLSILCTQAHFSGDANSFFIRDLERKNCRIIQSRQFDVCTNFNVGIFPFRYAKPPKQEKLEQIKQKAVLKIDEMAKGILDGKIVIEGRRIYQILLGGIQRTVFRMTESGMTKAFKFYPDKCIKCGFCARECPTGNISLILDEASPRVQWGKNCLYCLRCYNFCPSLAIFYGKDRGDADLLQRYKGPLPGLSIRQIRGEISKGPKCESCF